MFAPRYALHWWDADCGIMMLCRSRISARVCLNTLMDPLRPARCPVSVEFIAHAVELAYGNPPGGIPVEKLQNGLFESTKLAADLCLLGAGTIPWQWQVTPQPLHDLHCSCY